MYLRELMLQDAVPMLEWMHDKDVTQNLRANFHEKTKKDVELFIENSKCDGKSIHLAIASDNNEYMGTVSLKNINYTMKTAEFAITVHKSAMGHGYAWYGMKSILEKAFNDVGLDSVYWCVSRENIRAIRFYDKHNFHEAVDIPLNIIDDYKDVKNLKWYSVLKGDLLDEREQVAGCKIVHINTVPTVNAGELSFFESNNDISFDIKRIYYISKVPEGVRRGYHAHKELKQILFCPYGRIQLVLENNKGREEIELSDPSIGVVIEEPTWREMLWLQKDSVLCVAASDYYNERDYIRNYDEFRQYIQN